MVREDLIDGAVTFLQDPSVSSAPLEQKLSFLRSKNLTQEEIDASLARVGQSPTAQPPAQYSNYAQQYRQPAQQYGGYQQYQSWGQPPPDLPRRDWRDWFIMATVMGGIGYATYWTAKRYIYPLIAPPTPPQLEQDKASIDASFDKAFALLDQLATDTQELKDSEAERKQRLDHALAEVESVVGKIKEANDNREMEAKRMARELDDIKSQIPEAIQKEKEAIDGRLKDLAGEMKSLKTLVANRVGGGVPAPRATPPYGANATNGINGGSSASPAVQAPEINGSSGSGEEGEKPAPSSVLPERSASSTPYIGRTLAGKAQIPAWQLAAKKKAEEAKAESAKETSTSENGTAASDVVAGA
ncbi:peroxisomal membrane anchor protein conserved region-domain-containing protein [Neohortaea acidophila]|uniref:Peroxisomal membrane protein PEX14 n=1 Tax=Neohortaea acidophila TaxID=245834 RepID=A0A6A6Q7D6_9PEZI|nr:peroxisomal membrane anchor protein conserved region-domain-containing protein [Neohortaea acidophila]KAF2487991.1 peroxisomal membrane anchor protein conserved region-domain-containing protein [Neohortaea acidophila]